MSEEKKGDVLTEEQINEQAQKVFDSMIKSLPEEGAHPASLIKACLSIIAQVLSSQFTKESLPNSMGYIVHSLLASVGANEQTKN